MVGIDESMSKLNSLSFKETYSQLKKKSKSTPEIDKTANSLIKTNMQALVKSVNQGTSLSFENGGRIVTVEGEGLSKDKIKKLGIFIRFAKDYVKTHSFSESDSKEIRDAMANAKRIMDQKHESYISFNQDRSNILSQIERSDDYLSMNTDFDKASISEVDGTRNALIDKIKENQTNLKKENRKKKQSNIGGKISIGLLPVGIGLSAIGAAALPLFGLGLPVIILGLALTGSGFIGIWFFENKKVMAAKNYANSLENIKALENCKSKLEKPSFNAFVEQVTQKILLKRPAQCLTLYEKLESFREKSNELKNVGFSFGPNARRLLTEDTNKLRTEIESLQKSLNCNVLTKEE